MAKIDHDILIVGVGGQGVLLASEIISDVAMTQGYDAKKSEVHGMSQRGGIVSSHVRIGERVYSPTIQHGRADVLLAFEQAEGLRAAEWMKEDGVAIVSLTTLIPAIVTSSKEFNYPLDAIEQLKKKAKNVIGVPADKMAGELGNPRLVNTILIGVMSNYLPFEESCWTDAIRKLVKERFVEINLKAFAAGRAITLETVEA